MILNKIVQIFKTIFGCAMLAAGLYFFTVPYNIIPGGASGLATILAHFFPIPIGILILIINIPLLIFGLIKIGFKFVLKTLTAVIILSVFTDLIFPLIDYKFPCDMLLASVFGGVLIGIGVAMLFLADSSTGGTDIIIKAIKRSHPHFNTGTLVFVTDMLIILLSILVYKDIQLVLYSVISVFVSGEVIDKIIEGKHTDKLLFVVSNKSEEIIQHICQNLSRGVTVIPSLGGYTGTNKKIIMVSISASELYKLKKTLFEIDPDSFVTVTSAYRIFGNGFLPGNYTDL